MTMEAATITLPYAEFVKLQQRAEHGVQIEAQLRAEVASLMASNISSDPQLAATLLEGLIAARAVALFATGQLPPEEVRGWPAGSVRKLGAALREIKALVPGEPDLGYHADDLMSFAKSIDDADAVREARAQLTRSNT